MRVISQDGTMDFPYEISTIFIYPSIENVIAIQSAGDSEISIIGRYSSKEKAIKAMEMLREKYLQYISLQGGESAFVQAVFQPNYWVLPKVFQFPQDEDVEINNGLE